MRKLKKENGHTLIELVIVMAMVGVVSVLIWTTYLSIHRTNIRAEKKAQNLEDARIIINHITDNFHTYGGCHVKVKGAPGDTLEESIKIDEEVANNFYEVEEIIFYEDENDSSKKFSLQHNGSGKLMWFKDGIKNEIDEEVHDFKAKLDGDLLEFKIEIINEGHGVVADQTIDVGTTLNLKYMEKPAKEAEGAKDNEASK